MKLKFHLLTLSGLLLVTPVFAQNNSTIPNELIDYNRFQEIVTEMAEARERNRLTEEQFFKAMASGDYILLDARSAANFRLRHIKGAINLPFTEFTAESLEAVIPDKASKILIYCNNNFSGSPIAMATKAVSASLNLNTQASLRSYGYSDVYELGPVLDVETTQIPFKGTEIEQAPLSPYLRESGAFIRSSVPITLQRLPSGPSRRSLC